MFPRSGLSLKVSFQEPRRQAIQRQGHMDRMWFDAAKQGSSKVVLLAAGMVVLVRKGAV